MKCYVFIQEIEGWGIDRIVCDYKLGIYSDFEKAFAKLVELNHDAIKECPFDFYEKGYGEDYFPDTDIELAKVLEEANKIRNWDLFEKLLSKHIITDEIEINKKFINELPVYSKLYGLKEIEITE